jgi:hypothetical protein
MRHPKTRHIAFPAVGLVFCMTTHVNALSLKKPSPIGAGIGGVVPLLFTLPASSKSLEPAPCLSHLRHWSTLCCRGRDFTLEYKF